MQQIKPFVIKVHSVRNYEPQTFISESKWVEVQWTINIFGSKELRTEIMPKYIYDNAIQQGGVL